MKKVSAIILALLLMTLAASVAMAADKLGYIDHMYLLSQSDKFKKAQTSLDQLAKTKSAAAKTAIDKEKDENKKAQIVQNMQLELKEAENKTIVPVLGEINKVIEKVAKAKGVTVVLSRGLVHYGGIDITEDVVKELKR